MGGAGRVGARAALGMSGGRQRARLRLRDILPPGGRRTFRTTHFTDALAQPLACEGRAGLGQAVPPSRSWRCSP